VGRKLFLLKEQSRRTQKELFCNRSRKICTLCCSFCKKLEKYAQKEDLNIDMDHFDFNDPDSDNKLLAFGVF